MIEKIVLDYLTEYFLPSNISVYTTVPKNPNPGLGTFIVIEKTGSGLSNKLRSAVIAVQSYAPSLLGAADLNEQVITAMMEITSLDVITKVSLNSDYNFTDESTKQPRYQAVFQLTYYER